MTNSYTVLDSGVFLATVQTERYTASAQALLAHLNREAIGLAAPILLPYELAAVTRKWVYRGLASPEQAQQVLRLLLRYPLHFHFDIALLERGYELATQYNLPTAYDAQYLAVAERLACPFWTADERLFNGLNGRFPQLYWLGNWP
jgi:predicted nucleic acid-binding protein